MASVRSVDEEEPMHPHRARVQPDRREDGAGLVEYSLLLALIAVVVFSAVSFFGSQNESGFGKSAACIEAAYNNQPMPANCG
jgi:Flp pilus assembly pilin Flp